MKYITEEQVISHLNPDVTLLEFSLNANYDTHLAQIDFEDFENGEYGYSVQRAGDGYYILYESESMKDERHFDIDELEKMDNSELIELLDNLENYYYDSDDKDDLINCLLRYTNEDYYDKHYQTTRWYDLDCDFTISGYCKGDSVAVKLVGDVKICKQYLANIFYDVPVYGRLEITANGEFLTEIYLDEYLEDRYTWDKVQVINAVSNTYLDEDYHALLIDYLTNNLPDELEYI